MAKSKWPNQQEVVDGVTPADEVNQSPDLFDGDDVDRDLEMEDPDVDE
jgi:hypothetical protein